MSKLDTYYLLGRWTFRCQESGSSLSQAEPSSPSWHAVGSQAPQMGWGPGSCREGWVTAYRARWEQMASWGDQWVPVGIAECVYWPQRTPETLKTLQNRYCHLGATQAKTVKLLIVWVKKMAEISNSGHLFPSEAGSLSHSKLNLFLGRKECKLFNYTYIHKDIQCNNN